MIAPKPPSPPPPKPYPAMSFQKASGDPNNASGFGEKVATQLQCETRTDDIDLLPLSRRKRMLIHPDMPSKDLNARQVIPDFSKEWPGLPKGVKFDPSDEELLWHLLAETGKGVATRHPFIKEFIVSFDEDDGLGNVHPQFLPGVKQDGSMSYFFHRKVEMHSSRKFKRRKQHDKAVEFCWHGNGKLNLVCVDSIHQGFKEVLTLYMNPVNGGDAVKTPWSMHQYHIGIDGAEEDLVVSKIFYAMRSKQNIRDSRTDSVGGFVTEVVAGAAPIQVFATPTPAEPTIEELSQKVVDHNIGGETNAEHVGCLKAAGSRKYPTTYLEKARTNRYKHSDGTLATGELPLSESPCKAAAEISTFSTSAKSEISVKDEEEECVAGKRTDGFLACSGDFGISISNSNYDNVIRDDTCDSNVHTSMEKSCTEKSCTEKSPEHVLQKNVDKVFKTRGKFIATRSGEINTTGVCSSTGHASMEKHETYSKCLDEAHASPSKISSAEHSIAHANMINDSFVLGLPARSLKGKRSRETESKISLKTVDTSAQTALPIKIEPKSLEDTEIGIASDFFSNNGSKASASTDLLIKVKTEPFEEAEASIIHVEKVPSFSHLSLPINSSNSVNFCFSKANIQEKKIPHIYNSKEGTPSCNLSHHAYVPSTENLSTKISFLDELLSETTRLINRHPKKDDNVQDGLLTSNGNSQVIGDSECYPQINIRAGEPRSNSVSSSSSLNVKSEPVERSLPTYSQIPPCNTRGLASLMFENKIELCSDSPLDILDNIPLNHRLGISISEGDVNVERGNIFEESAPAAPPHRHSFGSADTKECPSSSRRKRKKTATISVEKAMEEDAPGLLKILLDRGIQVEEIKLYGDLEDNDPLETSSSEGSFEELETVMTKLFSERSSLLRFSSGRPMKGSGAFYFLAGLISLIEQTRYMRFRQIPVDWGWCRDLRSFIFVFQTHNRIVLERPEYGYATYFFELVDSLPVDWQIKRLVKAMKLTHCSRTILLENKPLIVGEDVSEGEARVLEVYGWTRNTGVGTLLNYVDRVVHDRRNVMHSSEWRAKIKKLLMRGYNGGRMVLTNVPEKAVDRSGTSEIKMEL